MDDQNHTQNQNTARTGELPAFLQPLVDRLHSSAKAETVFGQSRERNGRTIVPVARVAYGFGGGGGSAAGKKRKGEPMPSQPDEGVGGGGGLNVTPVGVFELTESGARFVPVTKSKFVAAGAFLAGVLLGMAIGASGRR